MMKNINKINDLKKIHKRIRFSHLTDKFNIYINWKKEAFNKKYNVEFYEALR